MLRRPLRVRERPRPPRVRCRNGWFGLKGDVAQGFGPIFATELGRGGLPLATQSGISSLVISRPPAHPSGHDRLEASATLRQTLKRLDTGDPRIHRLIGPLV
jgi:hypothetical protein